MTSSFRGALRRHSTPFLVLSCFLVLTFATGGGSRANIASLTILRPAAALFLAYGLWGLTAGQVRAHRFLFGMAVAIAVLLILQLIPLPPALWSALPGREVIVEIDRSAGLGALWRPLSMVPSATWNALFAMLPPMATLVIAARLEPDDHAAIMVVILGLGLASAILAVLQLNGEPTGPLYLYQITNDGAAVGLFANRNHQAAFLASLLPLLAAYASGDRRSSVDGRLRSLFALTFCFFLIPLILVTGSRAGLILLIVGLATIPWIYRLPSDMRRTDSGRKWLKFGGIGMAFVLVGLAGLTILLGRAESLNRLLNNPAADETRYRAWGPVIEIGERYFPFGTGFGTFYDIFQMHEPYALLAATKFNHAHNDWLEVFVTGGVAGLALLAVALAAWMKALLRNWKAHDEHREDMLLPRAGLSMLLIFAVASIGDYPLRVPSLACLTCVILIWANGRSSHQRTARG